MKPAGILSRLGFDRDRLRYSLRTALGACLALLIAWLAGLEHPQWAAMTVFAASQPARNMLVEKSFFRAAGTLAGTVAGVLLVLVADGQAVILVLGLAFGSVFARGRAMSCAGSWRMERSSPVIRPPWWRCSIPPIPITSLPSARTAS